MDEKRENDREKNMRERKKKSGDIIEREREVGGS